ncbi:MAG: hypothetical protein ABJF23_25825 [Bryobacteraceae bacterium]
MASGTIVLILDDVELGTRLARLAKISFRLGEYALGRQSLSDAGDCYSRAERLMANLSSAGDKRTATQSLRTLRLSIQETYVDVDNFNMCNPALARLMKA